MVNSEYSEAITEVLDILENSDDTITSKIPQQVIDFFEKNKSITYKPNLDHSKSLQNMNLKPQTKSIITCIYLDYLCDDEEEKKDLQSTLRNNEEKYQDKLREKYNPDNIFKNNQQSTKSLSLQKNSANNLDTTQNISLIKIKNDNFFQKIIKKIKSLFGKL